MTSHSSENKLTINEQTNDSIKQPINEQLQFPHFIVVVNMNYRCYSIEARKFGRF